MRTNAIVDLAANELTIRGRLRRPLNTARLRRSVILALHDPVFRRRPDSSVLASEVRYRLGFYLVGEVAMARLNETHLRHAGATDVITFDYGPPPVAEAGERWLCGEVFICVEVARRQAREFGATWSAEVTRYAVHGLLHLAGFDDLSSGPRRAMRREEDRLVKALLARTRSGRHPRPT